MKKLFTDLMDDYEREASYWSGSMFEWALTMKGVPYHWGGRTGWGFDCSGLVSLAAALVGCSVPRDASQQAMVGNEVPFEAIQLDDIAFFENQNGAITHVGICNGEGEIIHASGEVRLDRLEGSDLLRHEDGVKSHSLALVKRWR